MTRRLVLVLFLLVSSEAGAVRRFDETIVRFSDTRMLRERKPILIAHRGGVIGATSPEGSLAAIRLAARDGYDMVELDIRPTRDDYPVVFHDRNLFEDTGHEGNVSDLTREQVTRIPFSGLEETIPDLDVSLRLCRDLSLGVMLDFKTAGSEVYYERILQSLRKYDLLDSTITISSRESVRKFFRKKIWLRLLPENPVDNDGEYLFDRASVFSSELIEKLHRKGLLAIPALNTFHYSPENNLKQAEKDAERLLEAGADGFQIDSVYQHFFGLPKRPRPGF